ncbi:glycoside hydrolase [Hortaea werneckii]|nr:glycoside hydrolase [Hortaea werneckii]
MKATALYLSLLGALSWASPLIVARQNFDFEVMDDTPQPSTASIPAGETAQTVSYNLPAATAEATEDPLPVTTGVAKRAINARAACQTQPAGSGPVPSPDTAAAFLASSDMASVAQNAPVPAGYSNTFTNLKGSSSAYGYMGFTTLRSYDTQTCANKCDSIKGCLGFNLYFERDPTVEPAAACPNPSSTNNIKCVFWGGYLEAAGATNTGQWRQNFQVVIAGSNGYMKTTVPAVTGFTGRSLGRKTINAPLDCNGKDTYMGMKLFTTSYFDPKLCAAACTSQNEYNRAHPPANGQPQICKFFTTFLMAVNGRPEGQYCSMYTQAWDDSYNNNEGQWRGSNHYTLGLSFAYSNDASPGVPVCPADISYLQSEGAEFCTAYLSYTPPVTTASATATTAVTDTTSRTTVILSTTTVTTVTTITPPARLKRQDSAETGAEYSIAIETISTVAPEKMNASSEAAAAQTVNAKRALATPASISNWEPASISAACSQVATGTSTTTVTTTTTARSTITSVLSSTSVETVTRTVTWTATAPAVVLSSPTPIVGSLAGADNNYDDYFYELDLPFAIGAYGLENTHVYLSINGRVSLGGDSSYYTNAALYDPNLSQTSTVSILGFFDDLYIYRGTQQGIYYQVTGEIGSRQLVFEYYTSHYQAPQEYYHFTMTFYEGQNGVVDVKYYSISDQGGSATVGMQRKDGQRYMQYAFNTRGRITAGTTLRMNSNTGAFTPGTFNPNA